MTYDISISITKIFITYHIIEFILYYKFEMEGKTLTLFVVLGLMFLVSRGDFSIEAQCDQKCLSDCNLGCLDPGSGEIDAECIKQCSKTCCRNSKLLFIVGF